jgi:hypothetical protein
MGRTEKCWAFEAALVEEAAGLHTAAEDNSVVEEEIPVVVEDAAVCSMAALLALEPAEKACRRRQVDERVLTEQKAVLAERTVGCIPDAGIVAMPVAEDAVFVMAVLQTESQMNSHVAAVVELVSKFGGAVKK